MLNGEINVFPNTQVVGKWKLIISKAFYIVVYLAGRATMRRMLCGILLNPIVRLLFSFVCCVLRSILLVYSNIFKNKSLNCSTPFKHANRFSASTNNSKAFLRLKWYSRIGSLSRLRYTFDEQYLSVFFSYSFFVSSFVHLSVDIWCEYVSESGRAKCVYSIHSTRHTHQLNREQIFRILTYESVLLLSIGEYMKPNSNRILNKT